MASGRWFVVSAVVLGADQLTKWAAQRLLDPDMPLTVIPGFFALRLAHNTGAAFSLLADAGGWQRDLFIGLGVVVSLGIAWWILKLRPGERWTALGLSLVLGGALGNVIDRLRWGQVVDFLDFYYGTWHWPTFNLADSAITMGVMILIAVELFAADSKKRETRP